MVAVGGETTGFLIETDDGRAYELVLALDDREKLEKSSGMWFEIEGEAITIEGVEQGRRQAIIADQIRVLE